MPVQLSVSTYSLRTWRAAEHKTFQDTLDWIAAQDIRGVEFAGLDDGPVADPLGRAQELRRHCDKLGLAVASYCTGAELLVDGPEQSKALAHIKEAIDIAHILGAPSMRHDVTRGPNPPDSLTLQQVLAAVTPSVRQATQYGRAKGIKTSLENHGFYLQTADRVEALVQAVADSNFGITLDLGNFLCLNQDPVEAVRRLAKYAIMVHAKDFHTRPKDQLPAPGWFATPTDIALRGAIAGQGVIDLPAQLQLLQATGYSGWISLEFEGTEEARQGVQLGLKFLKTHLTRLGYEAPRD